MARDEAPLDDGEGAEVLTPEQERDRRIAALVRVRRPLTAREAALLPEALREIWRAHHDDVWAFLGRSLDRATAEDLVQETFLAFSRQVLKTGFPERIGGTLYGIAEGKAKNKRRGARREPFSLGTPSSSSEPPRTPLDPGRVIDAAELKRSLLPRLSDEHRAVIELCVLGDLDDQEAADMLGLKLNTLKSRLARAKRHLAELAEELLPGSDRAV